MLGYETYPQRTAAAPAPRCPLAVLVSHQRERPRRSEEAVPTLPPSQPRLPTPRPRHAAADRTQRHTGQSGCLFPSQTPSEAGAGQ